jgi:hypothetical protein
LSGTRRLALTAANADFYCMGDLLGVAVSPFELDEWQAATNIRPDLCMIFESWSRQRTLAAHLERAKSFGHTSIAVTWEPWEPTPVGTKADDQGASQSEWCSDAICNGNHDDYIDAFTRALRDSGMTVYLRFAHEMNGTWYPWFHHPAEYVAAWRYVRNRMRSMRNGWNIKFVWSPNPDLWRSTPADWLERLMPYWVGGSSTEYVGFTMIDFGGEKYYPVSAFAQQFDLARRIFRKPVLAMEVNVARENAVEWLDDLSSYVRNGQRPLPLVVLSQGSSRAAALGGTGDLSWSPVDDPAARRALQQLVEALHST